MDEFFDLLENNGFELAIYVCAKISHILSTYDFAPSEAQLEKLLPWTTAIARIPNTVLNTNQNRELARDTTNILFHFTHKAIPFHLLFIRLTEYQLDTSADVRQKNMGGPKAQVFEPVSTSQ